MKRLGSCNVSGNSPCQSKQICQMANGLNAGVTLSLMEFACLSEKSHGRDCW